MPRTVVTVTTVTGDIAFPAGTALDATNDHVITPPKGYAEKMLLYVTNTHGSAHAIIIKAGADYPLGPAYKAGKGDYTSTQVPLTSGVRLIGPLDTARFIQADGTINVDIEALHTGVIAALFIPRGTPGF